MNSVIEKIIEGLSNALELENVELSARTRFRQLEEWDSLNQLSFLVEIEEKFGKTIPRDVFEKMETVEDIAKYLEK